VECIHSDAIKISTDLPFSMNIIICYNSSTMTVVPTDQVHPKPKTHKFTGLACSVNKEGIFDACAIYQHRV